MGITTFSEVSHHTPRAEPEDVKREIQPILKQVRERMVAAGGQQTSGETKSIAVESRDTAGPEEAAKVGVEPESIPLEPLDIPGLPSGDIPPLTEALPPGPEGDDLANLEKALEAAESEADAPQLKKLEVTIPGLDDIVIEGESSDDFLSTSKLEDVTPLADMPDMIDLSGLEEGSLDDETGGPDLPS